MPAKTLFVGIGSPHGDDRLGWHVADALADRLQASETGFPGGDSAGLNAPASLSQVAIRKAASPADVLDWLDGIERLIICDACRSGGQPGLAYRWTWPDRAIAQAHCTGSHDLGLANVLELAQRLQRLPQVVIVWGVEAVTLQPQGDLSAIGFSASVAAHLADIVESTWIDIVRA